MPAYAFPLRNSKLNRQEMKIYKNADKSRTKPQSAQVRSIILSGIALNGTEIPTQII